MRKIAILSDIHGNHIALKMVLQDISRQGIQECFVLGDMVGYYYHPVEVMRLLNESGLKLSMIRGNHERMMIKVLQGELTWKEVSRKYGHGLQMAAQQLPKVLLQELLSLPDQRTEVRDDVSFLLCHGAPTDVDRYIYPDAPKSQFDFPDVRTDFVFLGHTHYSLIRPGERFLLVNPGSVGQARNRGGLASWCVVNLDNGVVTMQNTPYDIESILQECKQHDSDVPYLQDVLLR